MVRVEVCVPPPQVFEQVDHSLHEDTQSHGQACVLQDCERVVAGHSLPPFEAGVVTLQLEVCVPPPQVFEHSDQSLQAETTQSHGHACVLQGCERVVAGQGRPPFEAGVVTLQLEVCVPPPHVAEHSDQSLQAETTQSHGQGCVLQGRVRDVSSGHAFPPLDG